MVHESRHVAVHVARPLDEVCAFVADPAHLPSWAPGLGTSVEHRDGEWFVATPQGEARVTFAPPNPFGVLDHDVVTPSGETVHVPLRALPDEDGCEVVLTVRRAPGMSDQEFERDVALVTADLALLRTVLEGSSPDETPSG
ncbi:SRPBCC family protein [Cellulomonas endophytica]|uniref:SRPBCC family protein n=1 Tax=Cellulomonas endophytica TaxID=2494735 RepID=UPI001011DB67|nr:SRPBCC family protein [Cellulomonas endophytica]